MWGCDHLRCWSEDPNVPVVYHRLTRRYSLELSATVRLADMYCMLCGARDGMPDSNGPQCTCGCLARWAADPALPIEYDAEFDEYHFFTPTDRRDHFWFIHYCPGCGHRMPKSKRVRLPEPSETEAKAIRERTKDVKTVEDVIRVLGEPDKRFVPPPQDPLEKKIYGLTDIRLVLVYRSIAETADVHIQEDEHGEVSVFIDGKQAQSGDHDAQTGRLSGA